MRPLGLRSRLVLAISLLIAAMATFFGVYFLNRQEIAANDALEKRAAESSRSRINTFPCSSATGDRQWKRSCGRIRGIDCRPVPF